MEAQAVSEVELEGFKLEGGLAPYDELPAAAEAAPGGEQ
jgi:hypothetical protein